MRDEWGPWIEHDGTGCPVSKGTWVEGEFDATSCVGTLIGPVSGDSPCWLWVRTASGFPVCFVPRHDAIVRYRVRKPRSLTILEGLLENLPDRVDA